VLVSCRPGVEPARVRDALVARGLWVEALIDATGRTHFLVERHSAAVDPAQIASIDGVEAVAQAKDPHPLCARQGQGATPVTVAGVGFGRGAAPVWMSGPCSVESETQVHGLAARLAPLGVKFLRGGAYKPRSSPYAFQGHGEPALRWLREAADAHGMLVVTEAMGEAEVPLVARWADLVQIGSRNMQSYSLLRVVAQAQKPVLLKRGMAATVEEWLGSAEYCLLHGAPAVIFCERGIRGFDDRTRNVLDLGAVALLTHTLGQPVVVDPSHAAGRRDLVAPLSRAALAVGAAGLMIETHDDPARALSDGPQAVLAADMPALVQAVTSAVSGRSSHVH
jgi:3-deoxy-7-phosphoheptulonate synthase